MMKKILIPILSFLFILTCTSQLHAQQIDNRIREIFANKTDEYFTANPGILDVYNDLLQNRINLIVSPIVGDDKYPKLSEVPLLNKYNPDLKRDVVFDPLTFNVLKYSLNFFTNTTSVYRIDNTDYLIIIRGQVSK